MRIRLTSLLIGLLFLVAPHAANAWVHGAVSTSCPYGGLYSDGCSSANQNSNFKVSTTYGVSFYQHAATSGQTWASAHPWLWNSAGVDYPVGYDTTLTLKDPATGVPTGCTWYASGTNIGYTGPQIYCSGSSSVTLNGYDLTLYGGVHVRTCLTGGAQFTATNNHIQVGTSSDQNTGVIVACVSQTGTTTVWWNEFDGNNRGGHTTVTNAVSCNTYCDIEYNYAHDWPHQVFNAAGQSSTVTVKYNYIEGFSLYNCGGGACLHGSVMENQNSTASTDYGTQDEEFNTVVYPTGYMSLQNTTAFSFLGGNTYNQSITAGTLKNNVVVTNCAVSYTNAQSCPTSGGYVTVNIALTEPFRLAKISSWTVQNNFVDPHGAQACIQTLGSATGIVGTINNGSGGAGYLLTVTDYSQSASEPIYIYPYQYITSSADSALSVSNATSVSYYVLPYGDGSCNGGTATTGTGGDGTYCLHSPSGGPLNLASASPASASQWITSNAPINPSPSTGPTNPVLSGNTNLLDGSSITIGGIQFNSGQCNGKSGNPV
jgi:hypothetical protein